MNECLRSNDCYDDGWCDDSLEKLSPLRSQPSAAASKLFPRAAAASECTELPRALCGTQPQAGCTFFCAELPFVHPHKHHLSLIPPDEGEEATLFVPSSAGWLVIQSS